MLWAAGSCAALLASAVAVLAEDAPLDWLARTDQALATRNYEGVFVHAYAGETETLRVIHRVAADGVSERLLSMDGSGREFIRKGSQLTCYLPDKRTVLVEKSSDAGLLLGSLPRRPPGFQTCRKLVFRLFRLHSRFRRRRRLLGHRECRLARRSRPLHRDHGGVARNRTRLLRLMRRRVSEPDGKRPLDRSACRCRRPHVLRKRNQQ